jgi:hypothetical protein
MPETGKEPIKEIIHVHLFKPHKSLFKSNRKDKAICSIIRCNNYKKCGLYKRGECSYLSFLSWNKCPYGTISKETGFTPRARRYSQWISEREEKHKDFLEKLKGYKDVLSEVGDYVFLPYTYITMNEKVPFLLKEIIFVSGNCFLKKEHFTIDNIISICDFRPQAMMGGEITHYQREQVPKFIKHLSEEMPNIFSRLCKKYKNAETILIDFSNVGRKALLKTINKNSVFKDCHGAEWIWNGKHLTTHDSKTMVSIVNSKVSQVRVKPSDDCVMTISDDKQINDETVFVD